MIKQIKMYQTSDGETFHLLWEAADHERLVELKRSLNRMLDSNDWTDKRRTDFLEIVEENYKTMHLIFFRIFNETQDKDMVEWGEEVRPNVE